MKCTFSPIFILLLSFMCCTEGFGQKWQKIKGPNIPDNAVAGGFDSDGTIKYVALVNFMFNYPGGASKKDPNAYYVTTPGGTSANYRKSYSVLMGDDQYHWVKAEKGSIPPHAVIGDKERPAMGEGPKYICRCEFNESVQLGYFYKDRGLCYFSLGKMGGTKKEFEVLVKGPDPNGYLSPEAYYQSKRAEWENQTLLVKQDKAFEVLVREGELDPISLVAYSEDGRYIASNSGGDIILSDAGTGKVIRHIETNMGELRNMAFSPNGDYLATLAMYSSETDDAGGNFENRAIRLWDMQTGTFKYLSGHEKIVSGAGMGVHGITFSHDGKYLASTGRELMVWETKRGIPILKVKKKEGFHSGKVFSLAFSPDNQTLATGSRDKSIKIWNIASGRVLNTLEGHSGEITSLRFSKDGKKLISGSADHTLRLWDLSSGQSRVFKGHTTNPIAVAVKDDGNVVSIDKKGIIMNWKDTGSPINQYQLEFMSKKDDQIAADFNENGQYLVYTTYYTAGLFNFEGLKFRTSNNRVKIIDTQNHQLIRTIPEKVALPITGIMTSVDGKYLSSFNLGNRVRVFDLETVSLSHTFVIPDTNVYKILVSPDMKYIAYFSPAKVELCPFQEKGRLISYSNYENRQVVKTFTSKDIDLNTLIFNFKGDRLAATKDDKDLFVWKVNPDLSISLVGESKFREAIRVTNTTFKSGSAIAFSHQSDLIAAATQGNVDLFDVNTMEEVKRVSVTARLIWYVNFYQDDTRLRVLNYLGRKHNPNKENYSSRFGNDPWVDFVGINDKYRKSMLYKEAGYHDARETFSYWKVKNGMASRFSKKNFQANSPDGEHIGMVQNTDPSRVLLDTMMLDNKAVVSALAFSPNGKVFITGGRDGAIKLWDVATGELKLILASEDEEFIMLTQENYYRSSVGGFDLVSLRVKKDIYPFEVMDLKYNRPDLVLAQLSDPKSGFFERNMQTERLMKSFEKAHEKRIKKVEASGEAFMFDGELDIPQVKIMNQLPLTTEAESIKLEIQASDQQAELKSLHVFLNDVPVYGKEGLDIRAESSQEVVKEIDLPLTYGDNYIQVSVRNVNGVESFKESYSNVRRTGAEPGATLHLVNIGVSDYQDADMNLRYAAKDAQDLKALFSGGKNFSGGVKVHELLNANATKHNILTLKAELQKSSPDDAVVVFFAGHGMFDEELEYYMATYDMDFSNPSTRGIQVSDLEELVDGIPAQKKLLVLDACHSGEVDKDDITFVEEELGDDEEITFRSFGSTKVAEKQVGLNNSFQMVEELFADVRRSSGATIISAAAGVELAGERSDLKNGVFTFAMKEGLSSMAADLNGDGEVWVKELKLYLKDKVQELSKFTQKPTARIENLRNDWRIW